MSDKDKPEEIPLSGGAAPQQPKKENVQSGPEPDAHFDQHENIGFAKSLENVTDDGELLDRIVTAPREDIFPWEDVTLPSKGLYYDWTSGVIQVHPWGADVDRILATSRLAQTGQSVDYLINACCKFPDGFEPTDLLVGDQVFLLYYLRGITYGNVYEFMVTCPNQECGATGTHLADLNELAETIVWGNESLGQEPFSITLPYLTKAAGRDVNVGIRFLRVKDSQAIARGKRAIKRAVGGGSKARMIKRQKKQQQWQPGQPAREPGAATPGQESFSADIPLDDTLTKNIEQIIVTALGSTDRHKIRQLVDRMHSSDLATIREWLADNTPGIMTQVEIGCPECGNESRVMLPITEGFFRPENL